MRRFRRRGKPCEQQGLSIGPPALASSESPMRQGSAPDDNEGGPGRGKPGSATLEFLAGGDPEGLRMQTLQASAARLSPARSPYIFLKGALPCHQRTASPARNISSDRR